MSSTANFTADNLLLGLLSPRGLKPARSPSALCCRQGFRLLVSAQAHENEAGRWLRSPNLVPAAPALAGCGV